MRSRSAVHNRMARSPPGEQSSAVQFCIKLDGKIFEVDGTKTLAPHSSPHVLPMLPSLRTSIRTSWTSVLFPGFIPRSLERIVHSSGSFGIWIAQSRHRVVGSQMPLAGGDRDWRWCEATTSGDRYRTRLLWNGSGANSRNPYLPAIFDLFEDTSLLLPRRPDIATILVPERRLSCNVRSHTLSGLNNGMLFILIELSLRLVSSSL
jgi:hypothetical protein